MLESRDCVVDFKGTLFKFEHFSISNNVGDRQNDLKDERRRSQMSAARLVLERSTIMLLTSSKVSSMTRKFLLFLYAKALIVMRIFIFLLFISIMPYQTSLRHPECTYSKENRDTVFCQMRRAMDLIHYVVKDGVLESTNERCLSRQVSHSHT
jgi:hypothetical protein